MESDSRRLYTSLSDHGSLRRRACRRCGVVVACLLGVLASILLFRLSNSSVLTGTQRRPDEIQQAYRIEPVLVEGNNSQPDRERFMLVTNKDGTISLKTGSGKYVTAQADGTMTAGASQNSMWEHFERHKINGSTFLKSWHGKYVTAQSNGFLAATGMSQAVTERLQEVDNEDASVSLVTSHRKFVTVTMHGLIESPTAKFKLAACSHGIALQCSNGTYLGVKDTGGYIISSSDHVSDAECFSVSTHEGGRIALQSSSGEYLTAEPGGNLRAKSDVVKASELFQRIDNPDGTVSFKTSHSTFFDTRKMRFAQKVIGVLPFQKGQEHANTTGPTIFCFSYTMTHGMEWDTIREQFTRNLSIFTCNEWAVFSIDQKRLGRGVRTTAIFGPPARVGSQQGGALILNTDVFLRCWDRIKESQTWRESQWTVKVDVDSVFFPERLREHLHWKGNPWRTRAYFKNCKGFNSMQGPLEVYSRSAIEAFYDGEENCKRNVGGQYTFGEDIFMSHCMDLLGISPVYDWNLVSDQYCKTMPSTCACGGDNAWKAALHPCKSASTWLSCHQLSIDTVAAQAARTRKRGTSTSI